LIRFGKRDNIQIASVARRPIQKQKCQGRTQIILTLILVKVSKARAWTGPEDSRRFRLPDY